MAEWLKDIEDQLKKQNNSGFITSPTLVGANSAGSAALQLPTTKKGTAGNQYRGILDSNKADIWNKDEPAVNIGDIGNGLTGFITPIAAIPESVTGAKELSQNFTPTYVQGARNAANYDKLNNNSANGGGKPKGNTSGSFGGNATNDRYAGYRATLDDLYNKVMGYGSYTPGTYSAKYDTSGLEGQLQGWLNEIDNYGEFKYDLNADMLYKQMVDNSVQKGQLAAQDVMANAAALSGGYGNSYAAALGNQAYQQHLTALNNNIPALQKQALGVWQAGLDQLYGQLDAGSQQLNNLLALEAQNFAQWKANEANALNAWNAGYKQVQDQYNLGLKHANTMVSWQPQTVYSGGSSTPKQTATTQAATGNQVVLPNGKVVNTTPAVTNTVENPFSTQAYLDWVEQQRKK